MIEAKSTIKKLRRLIGVLRRTEQTQEIVDELKKGWQ